VADDGVAELEEAERGNDGEAGGEAGAKATSATRPSSPYPHPIESALVSHPCPLCNGGADRVISTHRGRIVVCSGCGLVRRDPIPSPDVLRAIYQADDYFQLSTDSGIGYRDYFADASIYRPYFDGSSPSLAVCASAGRAAGAWCRRGLRARGGSQRGLARSRIRALGCRGLVGRQRFDVDIVAGGFDDLRDSERWTSSPPSRRSSIS